MTRDDVRLARFMLQQRRPPTLATGAMALGVTRPVLEHCLELAEEYERALAEPARQARLRRPEHAAGCSATHHLPAT